MSQRLHWPAILLVVFLNSCEANYEDRNPVIYYPLTEERQQELVNSIELGLEENFDQAKTLYDETYPIEIILFENQSFYYLLKNLGRGWGEWSAKDGEIELKAKTELFVMFFLLKATDPEGRWLELIFEDRKRLNRLAMEFKNFP